MNTNNHLAQMQAQARAVMKNAYSPHSNFQVGACLRTPKNNFYTGCNIENVSFSLTTCAEAGAIAAMIAHGEKEIAEIVIVGSSEQPCTPCGACRQRIREFADPNILVHMFGNSHDPLTQTLEQLLPHSFGPQLPKKS